MLRIYSRVGVTIRPVCSCLPSVLEQESLGTGWMNCLGDSSPLLTPKGSRTQLRVGRDLLAGNNTEGEYQTGWALASLAVHTVYLVKWGSQEPSLKLFVPCVTTPVCLDSAHTMEKRVSSNGRAGFLPFHFPEHWASAASCCHTGKSRVCIFRWGPAVFLQSGATPLVWLIALKRENRLQAKQMWLCLF